jgi:rhamnosyltransferase
MRSRIAPSKENTCAVFVTFHPDAGFLDRLTRVARQVGDVIVIDNGSSELELGELRGASNTLGFALICNGENLGVAKALNQGMDLALSRGWQWALTFDQDTLAYDFLLDRLIETWRDYDSANELAVIGSSYLDPPSGEVYPIETRNGKWTECSSVITSGSLISMAAFGRTGPFREEFFIDCVDDDFCFRARRMGHAILCAGGPLMEHRIGTVEYHCFLGKKYATPNYPPVRRYYIMRNSIALAIECRSEEPEWARGTRKKIVKDLLLTLAFESNRWRKARMCLKGLWDGLRGKFGRLTDE